ncbi:phage protein [[Clostridium] sordellii]|uniref:hypothetical protein n=1 Tax=Paraclostridium sordellii TaxID=1505 RepID=UPI0005435005|nr:hypothetical protein [Paeniclostridium sordellii]CEK34627.1 phage protein [[Clostridium] sordellii] [Paeniclostridium sordellii]
MSKGYGNFFNDVITTVNHRYLKEQADNGCELSRLRLNKIMDPILSKHKDMKNKLLKYDTSTYEGCSYKFTSNNIEALLNLLDPDVDKYYSAYNCIIKILKVLKKEAAKEEVTAEEKLKSLALLKLSYKYKFDNDYDLMSKLITAEFATLFIRNKHNLDLKNFLFNYNLLQFILTLLEGLTPRQVLGLFPIEKSYDGEKYQTKDYYSSIEAVNDLGIDVPLNNKTAKEFLMECMIGRFMFKAGVSMMTLVSDYNNWDLTDVIGFMQEIKNKPHLKIVK